MAAGLQDFTMERENERLGDRRPDETDNFAALDARAVMNEDLCQFVDAWIAHALRPRTTLLVFKIHLGFGFVSHWPVANRNQEHSVIIPSGENSAGISTQLARPRPR